MMIEGEGCIYVPCSEITESGEINWLCKSDIKWTCLQLYL